MRKIYTTEEFKESIKKAASLRQSASTLKNDSSSRSHAVCRIRIRNPLFPSSENGNNNNNIIYIYIYII